MDQEDYDEASGVMATSLKPRDEYKPKNMQPTVITFDGNVVVTESGKSVWRKPGDAKSALRNHLENQLYRTPSWRVSRECVTKFMDEMQANGRLKFVPQGNATATVAVALKE